VSFQRVQRGKGHSYQLDGVKLPGVTTLINGGVPKPALIDWAARVAAEFTADHVDELSRMGDRAAIVDLVKGAHRRSTNAAAAKGTEIHGLAQRLASGEAIDVPVEIEGYLDGYVAFVDDWAPEVIALEAPIVNRRWFYGGTFDMLARLRDGSVSLIDIKTGGSGVWPEACLQIAAYRAAESLLDADGHEVPMPATTAGHALHLKDDGSYELLPVESGPDIFAVFLHCAHVAGFTKRRKDDLIGLPLDRPVKVAP